MCMFLKYFVTSVKEGVRRRTLNAWGGGVCDCKKFETHWCMWTVSIRKTSTWCTCRGWRYLAVGNALWINRGHNYLCRKSWQSRRSRWANGANGPTRSFQSCRPSWSSWPSESLWPLWPLRTWLTISSRQPRNTRVTFLSWRPRPAPRSSWTLLPRASSWSGWPFHSWYTRRPCWTPFSFRPSNTRCSLFTIFSFLATFARWPLGPFVSPRTSWTRRTWNYETKKLTSTLLKPQNSGSENELLGYIQKCWYVHFKEINHQFSLTAPHITTQSCFGCKL